MLFLGWLVLVEVVNRIVVSWIVEDLTDDSMGACLGTFDHFRHATHPF